MVEWLKIQDENGDTYLVHANNITYISKDGIKFRGGGYLAIPMDIEEVDRVITETRKGYNRSEQERWLNGEID